MNNGRRRSGMTHWICCDENMNKDRIMDSSASFHPCIPIGKERVRKVSELRLRGSSCKHQRLSDISRIWYDSNIASKGNRIQGTAEVLSKFQYKAMPYIYCINIRIYLATMILLSKTAAGVAIGNSSNEMRYNFRDTKSHQVIQSKDITFVDSVYEARYETISSSLTKPIQKSEVVLVDIPENLVKNDSIVRASRIVEDKMKRTLKTEHPPRREAPRLYSYEGPAESPGLYKESVHGKKAIIEEMVSLEKNQTCSLVRLPAGKKASQRLWMFKVKEEQNGRKRYKARLVVKGFQPKRGVDYNEIFSLVVKMTTIRLRHGKDQETQEKVVSRIRDEGFRLRKAYSRHEHH
ncbi:retrovirus-related pol polyprotein from transposon TNT 1-94 [Tanacetum coccineum]